MELKKEYLCSRLFNIRLQKMDAIRISSCPICSSDRIKKSLRCKDHLTSCESFEIFNCSDCNFSFTQNFPSEQVIGRYYEANDYISHTDTQNGIINKLYHQARKIAIGYKTKLVKKYTGKPTTLLDIGCGTGYFIRTLSEKGWDVTGIEKSEQVRQYTKQKFGLEVHNSEYLFDIPDKSQDVITMWHVLEHIEKLNQTILAIHRILSDNGTAFIALPNKESFDANHYKEYWAAYDVPRHLWHFSPSDFERLVSMYNFKIVEIKGMFFDPFYISMLSEKNKSTSFASIVGLLKGSIFCLRSIFNTKKSSSIIYILKKTKN